MNAGAVDWWIDWIGTTKKRSAGSTHTHRQTHANHPTTQLAQAHGGLVPFPMDLCTIHLKLRARRYRSLQQFHQDVELFFCGRERLLHGAGAAAGGGPHARRPNVLAQLRHLAVFYRSLYLELLVGEGAEWRGEARLARDEDRVDRLAVCRARALEAGDARELLAGSVPAARAAVAEEVPEQRESAAAVLAQYEGLLARAAAPAAASEGEGEAPGAGAARVTVRDLWTTLDWLVVSSPVRQALKRGLHLLTPGLVERALRGSGA